jgi:hypothetical protein
MQSREMLSLVPVNEDWTPLDSCTVLNNSSMEKLSSRPGRKIQNESEISLARECARNTRPGSQDLFKVVLGVQRALADGSGSTSPSACLIT